MMPKWWTVPSMWQGESVYIIGGGPSLASFDFSRLKDKRVIGCNDAFRLGPSIVDVAVFGDRSWFERNREELALFKGLIVTNHQSLAGRAGYLRVTARENTKVCTGDHLGWFFNTGALAINLAISLGAATIYLLGYDMKLSSSGDLVKTPQLAIGYGRELKPGRGVQRNSNWYPNIGSNNTEKTYSKFKGYYNLMKKELDTKHPDVKIFNCNPDSGLGTLFPKIRLEEAFA